MKLIQELLEMQQPVLESVTFEVSELKTDDPEYPKGLFTGEKWWRKEMQKCPYCEDGKEHYPEYKHPETGEVTPARTYDCDYCDGKGEKLEHVSDAPELNVANDNAIDLLNYLGIDPDSEHGTVGSIEPKDLPAIRRKLIKMKNGGSDDLVKPDEDHHDPQTRRYKDADGMDRIGRFGARTIGGGRTPDQVMRYVDRLLDIIDFAQKHNAHVTWA